MVLEKKRVKGIEIIEDIKTVASIIPKFVVDICVICEIAAAIPVLDFWKRYRVRKEVDITNVFIEPRRIRNCSRFNFLKIDEPITAA